VAASKVFVSQSTVIGLSFMPEVARLAWDAWKRSGDHDGTAARTEMAWMAAGWTEAEGDPFPTERGLAFRMLSRDDQSAFRDEVLSHAATMEDRQAAAWLGVLAEDYAAGYVEVRATDDDMVPLTFMERLAEELGGHVAHWERG